MSCIVTHPVPNARGEASLDLTPFKAWYCAPSCWPAFACEVGPSSLACLLQGLGVPAVIGNIGFVILCFLKSSSHLFPSALCADTGLPFYKTYHSVQVLFLCPANGVDLFKNQSLSLTVAWHFSFSLQGHWCYCVTASPRMDGSRECLTPQMFPIN